MRTVVASPPSPRRRRGPAATRAFWRPVDGSSLAVVRMVFGAVAAASAVRILAYGWVDDLYAGPPRHLRYPGLGWVPAPSALGMRVLLVVLAASAALVALGAVYRVAIVVCWTCLAWVEAIDVTTYLNHYWFMTLAGALMVVLPMDATWSVAARRRGPGAPAAVPAGAVWLLRAQVAVVYAFAGLAKVQADWLVHALPLRLWLPARADTVLIGPWLARPEVAHLLSWAGAAFDLSIVALLLWPRSRPLAWAGVVVFHVATWLLFPIGVFPWLMIGATTVFFRPDWPRRALAAVRGAPGDAPRVPAAPTGGGRGALVGVVLACLWVAIQVALPLRHHLLPGDARWTGEGYRFSWNVLLTEKAGDVVFRVTDPARARTWTDTGEGLYTPLQWRTMATDPELIRQAAHAVAGHWAAVGAGADLEVRVDAHLSLNGRRAARLIDPTVDLAHEPWRPGHQRWVLDPPPGSGPA